MSIRALEWALDLEGVTPTEKVVLFVYANYASADGEAWPGIKTVARQTCLHRSTVIRTVTSLEGKGLMKLADEQRRKSKTYLLTLDRTNVLPGEEDDDETEDNGQVAQRDPDQTDRSQSATPDRSHSATGQVAERDPNRNRTVTSLNRHQEEAVEGSEIEVTVKGQGVIPRRIKAGDDMTLFQLIRQSAKEQERWLPTGVRKWTPLDYYQHAATLVKEETESIDEAMGAYVQLLWEWLLHLDRDCDYGESRKAFNVRAARLIRKHGPYTALRAVEKAIDGGAGVKDEFIGRADSILGFAHKVLESEQDKKASA